MPGPFRITKPLDTRADGTKGNDDLAQYLERLLKMIPGEVVGIYLIGKGVIPVAAVKPALIWVLICFLLVIVSRIYGTADRERKLPPQPGAIAISCISFLIWTYSLGYPFDQVGDLYMPYIASLAILVWTFLVPKIYKGDAV